MAAGAAPPWGTQGPVQAEAFVLCLRDGRPALTGPCGPDAWYLEVHNGEDPMTVVARATRQLIGEPVVVHSTSWRLHRDAVVLSFVVVVDALRRATLASFPVARATLARGAAAEAAPSIGRDQVIEHALRHLAWLVEDDAGVRAALSVEWQRALADYAPEPFRRLGTGRGRPA